MPDDTKWTEIDGDEFEMLVELERVLTTHVEVNVDAIQFHLENGVRVRVYALPEAKKDGVGLGFQRGGNAV
jgi:hypothetical protein